jgi:predicted RNA-binding Zn ribbon-like protein
VAAAPGLGDPHDVRRTVEPGPRRRLEIAGEEREAGRHLDAPGLLGRDGGVTAAGGGAAGLDVIVETVATSVAGGGWSRLKLCSAEDCRWAFYDTSRNGGGRWCSMEACGNRNKTRAYRRRRAD